MQKSFEGAPAAVMLRGYYSVKAYYGTTTIFDWRISITIPVIVYYTNT